ncbi:NAD-dependent epimerase/dehydratase family protein [Alphaproteobacteria bacterium]|nr:NAD-dependent epimerase/dehydratase family protein [Alphaproteobacteria bacterium]
MKILITGVAGFIGFHLANKLFSKNFELLGIDNINSYYDLDLKKSRLKNLKHKISFYHIDIVNKNALKKFFQEHKPNLIIHLAAQAGVRYSINNPEQYISNNIVGFFNVLQCCKEFNCKKIIYASSSSVYGKKLKHKSKEIDDVNKPLNLYASSKVSNELMAHSFGQLIGLKSIGLRFFTVYGPWGRPDMSYYIFTKNILEGKKINVFGHGEMWRDFTYIDDIVNAIQKIVKVSDNIMFPKGTYSRIFNIGNNKPEKLMTLVNLIQKTLNIKAKINYLDYQIGDTIRTSANINELRSMINFVPKTTLNFGIPKFIDWYRNYHKINSL